MSRALRWKLLRITLIPALSFMFLFAGVVYSQPVAHSEYSYTELPGAAQSYPLRTRDIDVKDALRLFAKNLRIGLVLDETISGPITEDLSKGLTHKTYIDELANIFDFVWYFDGRMLHISPVGAMEIDVLALRDNSGTTAIEVLQRLGIYQEKFPHRADPRSHTLMVAGPKSYLEIVRKAVEAIEAADTTNITLLRGNEGGVPRPLSAIESIDALDPPVSSVLVAPEGGQSP